MSVNEADLGAVRAVDAVPADAGFTHPSPPGPVEATVTYLAMVLVITGIAFFAGRWWARRWRVTDKPMRRGVMLAVSAAIPCFICLLASILGGFPGAPLAWMAGTTYAAIALSFIAGFRFGYGSHTRPAVYLGISWAVAALMLLVIEERWVPLALGLGLACSALANVGKAKAGAVPPGWNKAQAAFSIVAIPPTLLLAFTEMPGWIAY